MELRLYFRSAESFNFNTRASLSGYIQGNMAGEGGTSVLTVQDPLIREYFWVHPENTPF
jgi:hypothetical protein